MFRFLFFRYVLFLNKGQDLYQKDAILLKFEDLLITKQYLAVLAQFEATFDFLNSRFLEPIWVSPGGSRNQDSTVCNYANLLINYF